MAYALAGAGDVIENQGDLQAARNSYQESLDLCKEIGDKQSRCGNRTVLSAVVD